MYMYMYMHTYSFFNFMFQKDNLHKWKRGHVFCALGLNCETRWKLLPHTREMSPIDNHYNDKTTKIHESIIQCQNIDRHVCIHLLNMLRKITGRVPVKMIAKSIKHPAQQTSTKLLKITSFFKYKITFNFVFNRVSH